jgi:hypothetical protein
MARAVPPQPLTLCADAAAGTCEHGRVGLPGAMPRRHDEHRVAPEPAYPRVCVRAAQGRQRPRCRHLRAPLWRARLAATLPCTDSPTISVPYTCLLLVAKKKAASSSSASRACPMADPTTEPPLDACVHPTTWHLVRHQPVCPNAPLDSSTAPADGRAARARFLGGRVRRGGGVAGGVRATAADRGAAQEPRGRVVLGRRA